MINIETLNLWKLDKNPSVIDGEGNLIRLGADNGANINIIDTKITHLRLCKGVIVYRKGPLLSGLGLLDYQVESGSVNTCTACKIVIS